MGTESRAFILKRLNASRAQSKLHTCVLFLEPNIGSHVIVSQGQILEVNTKEGSYKGTRRARSRTRLGGLGARCHQNELLP